MERGERMLTSTEVARRRRSSAAVMRCGDDGNEGRKKVEDKKLRGAAL